MCKNDTFPKVCFSVLGFVGFLNPINESFGIASLQFFVIKYIKLFLYGF